MADEEAKAAVRGKYYPIQDIPSSLANYHPPTNTATLKCAIKENNRSAAITYWESTEVGAKFLIRYPHLSPTDFIPHTHALPRSRATLLFRLITGHVQLQQHLHRLQVRNTPTCELCNDGPGTVAHLLLCCPRLASEPYVHLESNGRDYLHLGFLFSAPEAFPHLFDFLKATGCFIDTLC